MQKHDGISQRHIVEQLGIPRSTLQDWLKRRDRIDEDPQLVAFLESPIGVAFLHRLVLAAHFVITMIGPCGIRLVCLFLELTGLDCFVAASYGAQQKVSSRIEETIVAFDGEERRRLAAGMSHKKITVMEDETFHPETCLVGIEPESNFILLEKYATGRKAQDWTSALNDALADLPVEVIQSTSDEAKGILHHVEKDLGAHHSPDLFHVQHELAKGTSIVLANRTKQANKALEKATMTIEEKTAEKERYFSEQQGPGRPPLFDKRIAEAQTKRAEAEIALEAAQNHQKRAKEAIRGIGTDYHPYDLETGVPKSAEDVSSALQARFEKIETIASETHLPDRCAKKIQKAKRVVVNMVATIAFFFLTVKSKVEALSLPPHMEQTIYNVLIPGIYLQLASSKASNAADRQKLRKKSEKMLDQVLASDSSLNSLEKKDQLLVWRVAEECAYVFQRSSSSVEGRNGQLSLRHHGLHRIRGRKLAALTTVHNFFIKRRDHTTAAERFFKAKPRDIFQYLLDRIDLPGKPAQKRPQKIPHAYPLLSGGNIVRWPER